MADPAQTKKWINLFREKNIAAIALDCKTGKGLNAFIPTVRTVLSDRIKSWESKGMTGRTIKVMVVGIPNVGKSSFINRMSKQNRAKTEDRPGVTRGNQWYSIGKGFDLLDTPGVLWPKFDDPAVGEKLAFIGSVKDDVIDTETLCCRLLGYLQNEFPDAVCGRYKLLRDEIADKTDHEILEMIGRKRGMLISGGEVDTERAAAVILDEFRGGLLGKMTFDKAEDHKDVRI